MNCIAKKIVFTMIMAVAGSFVGALVFIMAFVHGDHLVILSCTNLAWSAILGGTQGVLFAAFFWEDFDFQRSMGEARLSKDLYGS